MLLCPNVSDSLGALVPRFGSPMSVRSGGLGEHENERCSITGSLTTVVDFRHWNSKVGRRCLLTVEAQHARGRACEFLAKRGDIEVRRDKPIVGSTMAFGKIRQADAELKKALVFVWRQATGRELCLSQYRPKPVSGIRIIALLGGRA